MSNEWPGLRALSIARRWPLLWAIVGFVIYLGGVVGGSALQSIVAPGLSMGWFQQIVGAALVLGVAAVLGRPRELLGLQKPGKGWLRVAAGVGLGIAALGVVVDRIAPTPSPHMGFEFFAYQATMPGVGEELGFRGLLLGLLATAGLQRGWARGGGWALLIAAAVPFALLHLLELEGFTLIAMMTYTLIAGVMLGWARMATGSLLPGIVAHNIANVAGGLAAVLIHGAS